MTNVKTRRSKRQCGSGLGTAISNRTLQVSLLNTIKTNKRTRILFGKESIIISKIMYLDERKVIRSLIANGALSDIQLFIFNSMSWILRVSMDGGLILCKRS